jgi:hypothetical protein
LIRHRGSPQISKHLLTIRAGLYLNPFQVSVLVIDRGHAVALNEVLRRPCETPEPSRCVRRASAGRS